MVKKVKLLVLKIDPALRKDFKRLAVENEETMTSILIGCIKRYIADKKKVVIH
jgi:hypothetical protein